MKKNRLLAIGLFTITFFTCLYSSAQKTKDKEVDMAGYTAYIIKLSSIERKYQPAIPISDIIVYDKRFDTTSLGFIEHGTFTKEKLLHFSRPASVALTYYVKTQINYSDNKNGADTYSLVCVIKKLFLSDRIYFADNKQASSSDVSYEIRSGVLAFFEIYAKSGDNYFPLYRLDTIITGPKAIYQKSNEYLEKALTACMQKLETINPEKIKKNNSPKSDAAINSYYNSRFHIPVLNENRRKGLYLTFESFRNNTPLDTPFTVDKSDKGDFLYVKNQQGEDLLQTELWGYCDGINSYIFSAENYFKLYRHGNSFIIYGAKDFTSTRRLRLNFGLLDMAMPNSNYAKTKTANSYSLELRLLQLDMESGELY